VNSAAAKFDQDDNDEDDADTPVNHRTPAHLPRSFSDVAGLHRLNSYAGSLEDVLDTTPSDCPPSHQRQHLRTTLAVAKWLARGHVDDASSVVEDDNSSDCDVAMMNRNATTADDSYVSRWSSADHGFISGLMTESAEFDASRLAPTPATNHTFSIFPASSGTAGDDDEDAFLRQHLNVSVQPSQLLDKFQVVSGPCVRRRCMSTACSVDEARRWKPRRRYSLASSSVSSDYEYRESLVSKGFSVDLGEDLDGIMTPPSTKPRGGVTVAGMESLHQALRQIQRDVDEMNRRFDGLRSSTTVDTEREQSWSCNQPWSPDRTWSRDKAWSPADRQCTMQLDCGEPLEQETDEDLCSERQQSDYIWDYRSDLVQEGAGPQFVALRPIVPSPLDNFILHRTNLPRDYSDLCTEASTGCGTDDGMLDLYIDDDLAGTDDVGCEQVPANFEMESQLSSAGLSEGKLEAASSLQGTVPVNYYPTKTCQCKSDFNYCSCCHHPVNCGHSDSCCVSVNRHCPLHHDTSPPHTRRSSVPLPCCHHHVHHTTLSNCCRHRDNLHQRCNLTAVMPSSRRSHTEDCDWCNNVVPECHTARTSTPAYETLLPLDHCNNFHNHSTGISVIAEIRPVGDKEDINIVIERTSSGYATSRQVCVNGCQRSVLWLYLTHGTSVSIMFSI